MAELLPPLQTLRAFEATGRRLSMTLAAEELNLTHGAVSRMVRLACLSPDVLERLVISRDPPSVSVNELIEATYLPWSEQIGRVFDKHVSIEVR